MKLAFCSEDQTDTSVLRALAERCCEEPVELALQEYVLPRQGGWTKATELAPKIARAVFRTDAHGAVFVIDCDGSVPHDESHQRSPHQECRHCGMVRAARLDEVLGWARNGLPPLQFILAVPVQVLETWLLLASSSFPTHAPATYGRNATERKTLKRTLYGTERPDRGLMERIAVPIAKNLEPQRLSSLSPSFHSFKQQLVHARDAVRAWQPPV